jgi:hypothetical protein
MGQAAFLLAQILSGKLKTKVESREQRGKSRAKRGERKKL